MRIRYSREGEGRALIPAAGYFMRCRCSAVHRSWWSMATSGAIFDPRRLALGADDLVQLVMVDNPPQHPAGDFHLHGGRLSADAEPRLTYSGIGVYHPDLFEGCSAGAFPGAIVAVGNARRPGRWRVPPGALDRCRYAAASRRTRPGPAGEAG